MVSTIDCKAICKSGGSINTIYPTGFDCELMLDIEGIPNIQMRYDPSEYDPSLAETIELIAEKGGSENTIFIGEITDKRLVYSGHTYKWNELEAMSWGKILLERGVKGNFVGEGSLVIHNIIAPLIADNVLSGEDIEYSGKTVRLKLRNEINIKDALRSLCSPEDKQSQLDYDFKVTGDKIFHSFSRGSKSGTANLADNALSYNYETTTKGILNTQNVYGKWTKVYGSDTTWFEDTINWNTADDLGLDTEYFQVGSGAIKANRDFNENISPIYLLRTLSPAIDIGSGAKLDFKMYHAAGVYKTPLDRENLVLRVLFKFYTDASYFECVKEYDEVDTELGEYRLAGPPNISFFYRRAMSGWKNIGIILGPVSSEGWVTSGSPDWSNINKFEIRVTSPVPETIASGGYIGYNLMRLDGGSITTRAYGSYKDSISIGSFGIRKGEDQYNTNLETNEECLLASSLIVQAYKDPSSYAKDLVTSKNFDASLGWEYPLSDGGIDDTLNVRGIHHRLNNFDFSTELEITDQWISIPEKLINRLERKIQTTSWKTDRKETEGEFQFVSYMYPIEAPFITTDFVGDIDVTIPTITYFSREIDNANTFRTWIEGSIEVQGDGGGYIFIYRQLGESHWRHISGEQPEVPYDGTFVILRTEDLDANTQFEVHACALTKYGRASAWSDIGTVTTQTNDVAPPTPSGLSDIAFINGVYLSWNDVNANDLDYYNILRKESGSWETIETSKVSSAYYNSESYSEQTFSVSAVDTGDNEGNRSNIVTCTPTKVLADNINVPGLTSGGSLDLSEIGLGDLDDIMDGSAYSKILNSQLTAGSVLLDQVLGDLDDIIDGTNFSKILSSQLSGGSLLLSQVLGSIDDLQDGVYSRVLSSCVNNGTIIFTTFEGDLDDIADGTIYARVRQAYLDAGTLKFTLIEGDLDDIADGVYGKVLTNQITAGSIVLSAVLGDLDDISEGDTYGRVLQNQITAGSITLDAVYGNLDDIADGTYGKVLKTQITAGSIKLSEVIGDLDDVDDGTSYGRVLQNQITAGSITLSAVYGDLDDLADGTSYGRILQTYISAGTIKLSLLHGDLDDISNGSEYGRVLTNQLTAGSITLTAVVGDLDDIDEGTNYGKVLQTQITAGSITLSAAVGDLDDIADGGTYEKVLKTQITAGSIRLDAVFGDLDDVDDGSSYGKVLSTQISAGSILLVEIIGDLDDIIDGTTYGRVKTNQITAGSIILSAVYGDLDDIDEGGTYGKVLQTQITAGSIKLVEVIGDLDDIAEGTSYGKVLQTQITAGSIRLDAAFGDLDDIGDGSTYSKVLTTQITAGSIVLGQVVGDLDDITDGSSYGKVLTTKISGGTILLEEVWADPSGTYKKLTRLGAGEIYSDHVGAGVITAKKIALERIATQTAENALNPSAGNIWYRSDVDQLRFEGDSETKRILTEPLPGAPSENLVLNASFELRNAELATLAEFWIVHTISGSPTYSYETGSPYKGGKYVGISLSASGEGKLYSTWMPVFPGQKLVLETAFKELSVAQTHVHTVVHMIWSDRNKENLTESNPPDAWKTTTTSWVKHKTEFTVPSGKYYARVALRHYYGGSGLHITYYDDIILSEQRAATPTAEIVATTYGSSPAEATLTKVAWSQIGSLVVPSVDHECLFVEVSYRVKRNASESSALDVSQCRLKHDSTYYPRTAGIRQHQNSSNSDYGDSQTFVFFMTIPSNMAGETVYVEVWNPSIPYDRTASYIELVCWGHTPHSHR